MWWCRHQSRQPYLSTSKLAVVTSNAAAARVELVDVDETVLSELVEIATSDAHANEVTPPLTLENSWTPERIAWLQAFHRERRSGLTGPAGEATWAVTVDGRIVGSVRLKATAQEGCLETGAWLSRTARGRGVGRQALGALLELATAAGAEEVRADTTSTNSAALGLLRRLAFGIGIGEGGAVRATLHLPGLGASPPG